MTGRYPRRFGKYVLLKPLAKGGMGEIYMAAGGEIGGFEKLCVIKKVLSEKADRSKANRFLDEAKVVLRLSHSALVTTFDAGEVDGEFYIAMELVEGKDLREVWNRCVRTRQRIPLDVALHVVREVARALAYVHAYGDLKLVHRDVAPPNILLAYVGDVKLTDFGLARSVLKQEHTAPGVVFGRAAYLAPEQARGEVADARTDVYTLGIVLWELLTGQQFLQISGLDPAAALAIVRHPKVIPPSTRAPWLTPALDAVVLKALAVNRDERFQSADEMRRALSEVIATIAPRAGADRVSEFLHTIYAETIDEERREREQFLRDEIPRFRGGLDLAEAQGTPPVPPPEVAAPPAAPVLSPRPPAVPVRVAVRPTTPAPRSPRVAESSRTMGAPKLPGLPPGLPPGHGAAQVTTAPRPQPMRAASGTMLDGGPPPAPQAISDEVESDGGTQPRPAVLADFVGRTLGNRYRVLRQIGEGGMGRVYAAEHVEIGKGVAVKVLHPACSTRSDLVERFRREARAASKIGHPGIVNVTDFGTTEEGLVYYVMEQLAGVDLADVLAQEGRIEPVRAVQIAVQMCQALAAAHAADIVHRDLKPENIFLQPRGAQGDLVKILDFGLARSLEPDAVVTDGRRLTNPGMPIGTPEYMAPEQADGKPADARADIYATGAILYEMVTGTPAFTGSGYAEILARKGERPQPPRLYRPDIPEELEQVILASLERDPGRRPQTMAELEYALVKILRGRGSAVAARLGLEVAPSSSGVVSAVGPELEGQDRRRSTREAAFRAIGALEAESREVAVPVGWQSAPPALVDESAQTRPRAPSALPPSAIPGGAPAPSSVGPDTIPVPPPPESLVAALAASSPPSPGAPPPVANAPVGQALLERYGLSPDGKPKRSALSWTTALVIVSVLTGGAVLALCGGGKSDEHGKSGAPAAPR